MPRLALGGHVNHAFGCEHLENAARMRGKADVSRAIFEEAPNASASRYASAMAASPASLGNMGVIDGRVARKCESDGRVFAFRPFVELGDVGLEVGDRIGVLACE